LTSGDSGIVFKFFPTVVNPSNPTFQIPFQIDPNATVKMLIQLDTTPLPPHEEFLMTKSTDGTSASYMLTGVEFPVGGCIYRITMRITSLGSRLTADEAVLFKVDEDFTP
jgi:hypothetical protein